MKNAKIKILKNPGYSFLHDVEFPFEVDAVIVSNNSVSVKSEDLEKFIVESEQHVFLNMNAVWHFYNDENDCYYQFL